MLRTYIRQRHKDMTRINYKQMYSTMLNSLQSADDNEEDRSATVVMQNWKRRK